MEPTCGPRAVSCRARSLRQAGLDELNTAPLAMDRLKAFENANDRLSQALSLLQPVRESLTETDLNEPPEEENFVMWVRNGLPRPRRLADTGLGLDAVPREPFPTYLAFEFIKAYLEWEARIARELGDVAYRDAGGAVAAVGARNLVAGDGQTAPTAAGYYQQAREALFLADLLDARNRHLAEESYQLDQRVSSLRHELPYGGEDFYRFGWRSDTNNIAYWEPVQQQVGEAHDVQRSARRRTDQGGEAGPMESPRARVAQAIARGVHPPDAASNPVADRRPEVPESRVEVTSGRAGPPAGSR